MNIARIVANNQRLRNESVWQFLAGINAPVVVGLLQAHLFGKERRLASSILNERIARDLDVLRSEGWDLPQTSQVYLSQWLVAGYLERSYEADASEEAYELSAAAIQVIRFVEGLGERRTVATESRLSLVIQQLVQLAEQTETDPESRVEQLMRERERVDAEIASVRAGRMEILSGDRATERAREIVALADELANDFRQVREKFQHLNRQLRERIVQSDGARGGVLEELFAGVDVIAESDSGRTFKAFWRLLTDPGQSLELEEALEQLLSREFMRTLDRRERRFLSGMTKLLLERGGDVHEAMQQFARSLKQFVQSREYMEQRRLTQLLKDAQRIAVEIKDRVKATHEIGHTLHLTSAKLASLSQFRLHDPDRDRVAAGIPMAEAAEISLEAVGELVAHSEIDFRSLKTHIVDLLTACDQLSIARILEAYPAEQGLGSVVGYLALGTRHGVSARQTETVHWQGQDGVGRRARIPCIYFVKGCFDESQ
ncbi:MAG: hypothetical protein A2140_00605 [Candidatus Muproteobacteria bacterium RBG_16_62_13]|uniref:DUF3375 domain-containing protein n=1 Tax=Candidatus Muproteobacteria bacterium RBG_16_62_13 TaxID=1817756 RepID=A0A1F6T060_9PROT|nr:MAG: hypothetical protein A2140_00605 [Candidatus Muproteobacteria bacterium RBG_16_62_13]